MKAKIRLNMRPSLIHVNKNSLRFGVSLFGLSIRPPNQSRSSDQPAARRRFRRSSPGTSSSEPSSPKTPAGTTPGDVGGYLAGLDLAALRKFFDLLVAVLVYTATRVGAVAKLTIKSLQHEGSQYALRFSEKGSKSREIPVRHDLKRATSRSPGSPRRRCS